ncbi:hypothetical protein K1720_07455 [Thermococcus argininiproducens]|uniref:Uncharacterized protein n=1 Tax=Thermococcus argininiproducens TaxID=2866384 RepID=A0A9E7SC31_9EURY|nr:hypothetical protein [Thermococcus argininiproducens]USG99365.1 hypothetical protein K1720_07455 [Thermococcus argininiproducens]
MSGTVSKIVRFNNEEEFLEDIEEAMERFTYLASRYGVNVIEGILLWDYVGIRDEEGIKIFRIGEFPYVEGTLRIDLDTLKILERYFDEIESRWEDLTTSEINYFVEMLNDALGEELVYYEAYGLGLERNEAYIILNIKGLYYLENVIDMEDRSILDEAVSLLMKYM